MRIRPRSLSGAALAAVLAVGLTACSDAPPQSDAPEPSGEYSAGDLTLDAKPENIVSLSATTTEMLFAIDAGDQVEAVDSVSNYPESAPITDLDAFSPNVEAISGYEPDLVVLSHDQEEIISKLSEVDIPVYYAPAAVTLEDTYQQITDLGALTGHVDEAETLNTQMAANIDDLIDDLPDRDEKLTAYYELSDDMYSLTSDTFAGSLLKQAGLENIADTASDAEETGGYPQLSAEFIVDENPDMVFMAAGGEKEAEKVADRDGWDSVAAVKSDNIVALDADIASRWGPRVVDLMQDITDAVAAA